MFLAIFPFFGSEQCAFFLSAPWGFQVSNIQYIVVLDSFREEKRSQNEPGQLIGDDTCSKFITFLYTQTYKTKQVSPFFNEIILDYGLSEYRVM